MKNCFFLFNKRLFPEYLHKNNSTDKEGYFLILFFKDLFQKKKYRIFLIFYLNII